MARQLEMTQEQEGDVLIFTFRGPLDALTLEQFDGTLGPVFRRRNARAVVDCSDLTFICSTAMGRIIEYHRQCCLGTGRMVICCSNRAVIKWFERLKVDAVVRILPTRAEALAALAE